MMSLCSCLAKLKDKARQLKLHKLDSKSAECKTAKLYCGNQGKEIYFQVSCIACDDMHTHTSEGCRASCTSCTHIQYKIKQYN